MIRVNFIVENFKALKYLGCSTAAQQILEAIEDEDIEIKINSNEKNFDIVHAHTFGPLVWLQILRNKNAVKIISAHSTPSINKNNIVFGGSKIWNIIYRTIYNRFDYVIAVSEFSVRELKSIGVNKEIFVVENGVNMKKFRYDKAKAKEFREEHELEGDFVVLNVAQVTPRKGVYEFIETAKLMPWAKFVWIGGFPYKFASADYFKLKKIVEKNAGLKNLKFLGFVPDIVGAYSGADVLFTPSFAETFGLTIIEAGACKLPVVARDLKVFRELFGNYIEYASHPKEFAKVLERFKDKNFREKQSLKAYELAKRYDMKIIGGKLVELYKKLVKWKDET